MGEYSGVNPPDSSGNGRPASGRFPPEQSHVRLSDAERDIIANELGEALSVGRLTPDEHAERLDALFAAKTQGELEPLLADLPAPHSRVSPVRGPQDPSRPPHGVERLVSAYPTSLHARSALSGAERTGGWVVPVRFPTSSFMGSVTIDLREARFLARVTTIKADTFCGSIEVIVPDDVIVRVDGTAIMGAFWLNGEQPRIDDPYAPIVNVTGYAFMGSVWAEYKPRAHQRQHRRWWQRAATAPGSQGPALNMSKSPRDLGY